MLSTVSIVIGAAVFAAPIRASGAAQILFGKVEEIAKTPGRFAAACYIIHPIFQLVAVTYYVTYPVMGSFCAPVYDKFGLSRANLTRTFEDSGTVIAPLIPWGYGRLLHYGAAWRCPERVLAVHAHVLYVHRVRYYPQPDRDRCEEGGRNVCSPDPLAEEVC